MKKRTSQLLVFALLAVCSLPGQINLPHFRNLTTVDGLSQNSVSHILQDSEGMIWIATQTGVDKYVGTYFIPVKGFTKSLVENITGMFEWDDKHILVCTNLNNHLLKKWGQGKDSVRKLDSTITNIQFTANVLGKYLLFTQNQIHHADNNLEHTSLVYDFGKDKVVNQVAAAGGQKWFLAMNNGLWVYHVGENAPTLCDFRGMKITSLFFDADNSILYCGTGAGEIYTVNPETEKQTGSPIKFIKKDNWTPSSITAILTGDDGKIWVGTKKSGLIVHHTTNIGSVKPDMPFTSNVPTFDPLRFSSNAINTLFRSSDGVIWVGTDAGGLNLWQNKRQVFHYALGAKNSPADDYFPADGKHTGLLYNNNIWSLLPHPDNPKLIIEGTKGNGAAKVNYAENKIINWYQPSDNNSKATNAFAMTWIKPGKSVLIGTGNGLYEIKDVDQSNTYSPVRLQALHNELNGKQISILADDNFTDKWLTGNKGDQQFYFLSRDFKSGGVVNTNDPNTGISFLHPFNDLVLVGATNGLFFWDRKSSSVYPVKDANKHHFTCAYYDEKSGQIWLGTDRKGLYCYQKKDLQFIKKFDDQFEFANEVIYDIQADHFGILWFSTNHGIFQFNPKDNIVKHYEIKDGLEVHEYNGGAFASAKDSIFFFGGINGLTYFVPSYITANPKLKPRELALGYTYPSGDTIYLELGQNVIEVPYQAGYLQLLPFLGEYQDIDNNKVEVWLNGNLQPEGENNKYIIQSGRMNTYFWFWRKNELKIRYKTGNSEWTELNIIVKRQFFTGANPILIILITVSGWLLLRTFRTWRKLLKVQSRINDISRLDNIEDICNTALQHFVYDFKYDYAVISLVDFEKKVIRSKYGLSRQPKKTDPKKWKKHSVYPLNHEDILAQTAAIGEPVIVINNDYVSNSRINKAVENLYHPEITKKFGHNNLSRIFFPVVLRSNMKDEILGFEKRSLNVKNDIVLGVIEVGLVMNWLNSFITRFQYSIFTLPDAHLNVLKYFENEKVRLNLYADNFAQPYYKAYVKSQKQAIYSVIEDIEKESEREKLNHNGFLELVLKRLMDRIGVEYGDISLMSFNAENIDFTKNNIVYGYTHEKARVLAAQFEHENKHKFGIINWVVKNKEYYYTGDVNNDDKYKKFLPDGVSELAIPMMLNDSSSLIGVLNLISTKPNYFNSVIAATFLKAAKKATEIYLQKKQYNALKEIVTPLDTLPKTEDDIYISMGKSLKEYFRSDYISVWVRSTNNTAEFYVLKTATEFHLLKEYERFKFTSASITKDYDQTSLLEIIHTDQINNHESRIYQFCKQAHLAFKSYIVLKIVIDDKYVAFINVFSKRKIQADEIEGYSKTFLNEVAKKVALAVQNYRLTNSMEEISDSLTKRETEKPMEKIVKQAFRLSPSVDSVILYPYHENKVITMGDAVIGGDLPQESADKDKTAHFANYIINNKTEWIESEDQYIKLAHKIVPDRPDYELFWNKRKLKSVAAIKLEHRGEPVGVMFFNYRVPKKFKEGNTRAFIDAFTNFAKIALLNEDYIQRIQDERLSLDNLVKIYSNKQKDLEYRKEELQKKYVEVYDKMKEMLPAATRTSLFDIVRQVNHDIINHLLSLRLDLLTLDRNADKWIKSDTDRRDLRTNLVSINLNIDRSNDLIKLFKPSSFKETFEDLNSIVLAVSKLFTKKYTLGDNKVGIQFDLTSLAQEGSMPEINCVKAEMSMIIFNLISNAEKAILEKIENERYSTDNNYKGIIQILTSYEKDQKNFILEIRDNGIGIDKDYIHKIFDAGETSRKSESGKSELEKVHGIGLYFVKECLTNHYGGEINCISFKGKSTTFKLKIKDYIIY